MCQALFLLFYITNTKIHFIVLIGKKEKSWGLVSSRVVCLRPLCASVDIHCTVWRPLPTAPQLSGYPPSQESQGSAFNQLHNGSCSALQSLFLKLSNATGQVSYCPTFIWHILFPYWFNYKLFKDKIPIFYFLAFTTVPNTVLTMVLHKFLLS